MSLLDKLLNFFSFSNKKEEIDECEGISEIRPGNIIVLQGLGTKFKGEYLVQSSTHRIDTPEYSTTFKVRTDEDSEDEDPSELQQFQRNKFFYGKLLTVCDFQTEQEYYINKRRLITRLLNGHGMLNGFRKTMPQRDLIHQTLLVENARKLGLKVDEEVRIVVTPKKICIFIED